MNIKGTTNLFVVLSALAALGVSIADAFEDDGKISGGEIGVILFQTGLKLPSVLKKAGAAFEEAKDLTVQEVATLVKQIQLSGEYEDLTTPKVAAFIELGLRQLQLFQDFKDLAKDTPPTSLVAGNVFFALSSLQNSPSNFA